jgi:hypothetical protein
VTLIDVVTSGTSHVGDGIDDEMILTSTPYGNYPGLTVPNYVDQTNWLGQLIGLTDLYTTPITQKDVDYQDATVNITATDGSGQRAQRTITLRIYKPVEIFYNGHQEVVRTFDPVAVSGCMSGGNVGTNSTYSESTVEQRTRNFRINGGIEGQGAIDIGWVVLKDIRGTLSARMGFEVDGAVSSADQRSLQQSVFVVPGEYMMWYRQTTQLVRIAQLIAHGVCGDSRPIGHANVTDWVWASDPAKSQTGSCNPSPRSNLPPGQVMRPDLL